MRVVVVRLFISDGRSSLFEEDFIWTQWLLRTLYVAEVAHQTGLRDSPLYAVSSSHVRHLH